MVTTPSWSRNALLGAVATTLHAQPLLSADNINNAAITFGFLAGSGLDSQIERVRFTPTGLSLEEFSKLWSVFFQVEYSLSAAYQASLVLMESDDTPFPAPPVLERNLYVLPFESPYISAVVSKDGNPITVTSTILVQGTHLRAPNTFILIEDQELIPATASDTQLSLALTSTLHAGVKSLQVLQKLDMGTPAAAHRGFESNVASFVLCPTVSSATGVLATTGTDVTLNLVPNIGIGQRIVLLLNNVTSPPTAYASSSVLSTADSSSIVVNIANVPTGTYIVRVAGRWRRKPTHLQLCDARTRRPDSIHAMRQRDVDHGTHQRRGIDERHGSQQRYALCCPG